MVPPNNQMFANDLEGLIDTEQQPTDTAHLRAIELIVEQAFASFLDNLTLVEQDPADKLLKPIKALRTDLEEHSDVLKAHTSLLKELMSKVNDIRTISRDIAVKMNVPLPLKKNERKSRSPGFTQLEIDIAMDSAQKKVSTRVIALWCIIGYVNSCLPKITDYF